MSIEDYKKAAYIHNLVRSDLETSGLLSSGTLIIDLCKYIENKIRYYSNQNEINGGIAFPVGISNNNIAAHYSPSDTDTQKIGINDVCSIDYGVHINGHIIDSAFTININQKYNKLLEASHKAVTETIKSMGCDVIINELSENIQEIVTSYELESNGKLIPIKPIDNLCGHNILPWKIHGEKTLYAQNTKSQENQRICDGDVFAVEVFTSTGNGTTYLDMDIKNHSHYMLKYDYQHKNIPLFTNKKTNDLSKIIKDKFNTLAFCPRFIDYHKEQKTYYTRNLFELFNNNIIQSYPPLIETKNDCKVAQYEHTIMVKEESNIIFTENQYY